MKKFVVLAAGIALALGAIAADKADSRQAPKLAVKMTDAQLAKKVAGNLTATNSYAGSQAAAAAQSCNSAANVFQSHRGVTTTVTCGQ